MPRLALLALLTCPAPLALAQPLSGFDFMRLDPSARASALGGTLPVYGASQGSALYYNPALVGPQAHRQLSLSWLNHLSDVQAGLVTYARNLGRAGMGAAGIRFLSWGSIPRTDAHGGVEGSFSSNSLVVTTGLSRLWRQNLHLGASLHAAFTGMDQYRAVALAADLGAAWHIPAQQLTLAGSISRAGVSLSSLGPTQDELPVDVRLSVAKRLRYIPALLALTLNNLQAVNDLERASQSFRHAIFSLEFQAIEAFHVRFGYNHGRRSLRSGSRVDLAGVGIGCGIRIRRFQLDYAYSSWSFAGIHQFTATTRL